MKKKRIASKLLSIMLSAAVVVSSSFSGVTLFDVSATEVPVVEATEDVVSGNTTEDVADVDETEDVSEAEVETKEEVSEAEDPEIEESEAEEPEEEEQTEVSEEEMSEDSESADTTEIEFDDVEPDHAVYDSTLVKGEVPDANLRAALQEIYEKQTAADDNWTDSNFTIAQLKLIKSIDLSTANYSNAGKITDCSGLKYAEAATLVDLSGTSVTEIKANEFNGRTALVTVVLPTKVTGIGENAFRGCTSLVDFKVGSVDATENTLPTGLLSSGTKSNIFRDCTSLTSFKIPSFTSTASALQDANGLFYNCTGLKTVTIEQGVDVIPGSAFYGAGLRDKDDEAGLVITFTGTPELDRINDGAFQYASIKEIDLGNCLKLSAIGNRAFAVSPEISKNAKTADNQKLLETVILPNKSGALTIGNDAFFRAPLDSMYIKGAGDTEIVHIPDYVTSLGTAAFYENKAMKKLKLSANLDSIKKHTFDGCSALTSVTQSTDSDGCQITYIGDAAFRDTTNLADAEFLGKMDHLKYIGEQKLTQTETKNSDPVKSPDYFDVKVTNYGSEVFRKSGIQTVTLPASLRVINSRSFSTKMSDKVYMSIKSVVWKTDNSLKNGEVYEINSEAFNRCGNMTSFVYPKTEGKGATFNIGTRAFAYSEALLSFKQDGEDFNSLPRSMKKLGSAAFIGGEFESMKIENCEDGTAPELGENVFEGCYNLSTVVLPSALTEIPAYFFYDCALTALPTFSESGNKIEEIGDHAFFGNSMVTADLSSLKNLNSLGAYCFAYYDTVEKPTVYAQEVGADGDSAIAPLKRIILPATVNGGNMTWGRNLFLGAKAFDTMTTPTSGKGDGTVYIPNYVKQSGCSTGVFAGTAVSKVYWGYVDAGTAANKWETIPAGMFAWSGVSNLAQACLPASDLRAIDTIAYASCPNLTAVDLSIYPNLEALGEGVFSACVNVKKVKLPNNGKFTKLPTGTFLAGRSSNNIGVEAHWDSLYSSIETIDFGGVTEIGKWAFASCDYEKNTKDPLDSKLKTLDFTNTRVLTIGDNAFRGHGELETLKLGSVQTIGETAFQQCVQLNMTSTPMSDSVQKIGKKAFYQCESLGTVKFGAGLVEIGEEAFAECAEIDTDDKTMEEGTGLVAVDFAKAKNLILIGKNAFTKTAITDFDASATAVKQFIDGTVSDCPYLQSVKFGLALQKINGNALKGCTALREVRFYSTTTVEKEVFKNQGYFKAVNNGYTPIKDLDIYVEPVELNVGIGKAMKFPYYVSKYDDGSASFSEMHIGNAENTDNSIVEYVKVSANTSGYFLNKTVEGSRITDSRYFESVTDLNKMKYSVNGVTVLTFDIMGLKPTPAGKTIPFTITNNMSFAQGNETITNEFSVTYNMKVVSIPYYAKLYEDKDRTKPVTGITINPSTGLGTGDVTINVNKSNTNGNKVYYYDIFNLVTSNWQPENGNLIIKTSNPDVVTFNGATKVDDATWIKEVGYGANETRVSDATKGENFTLQGNSHGDAVVTIYPENCPSKTIKLNVHVKLDISAIYLSVPNEYRDGVQLNTKFSIVDSIRTYKNKEVSRKLDNIADLSKYTDNKMTYTSSNPDVASISASGVVTIKKVTTTKVPVTFTATAALSDGQTMQKTITYNVVYPKLSNNREVTDHTGTTVKVTGIGSNPTVTYVAPSSTATTVKIPNTMMVNGVSCKVTEIAEGAFTGNKKITKVTLGSNIKVIAPNMFKGCTKLTTVTLGSKTTEIGEGAFNSCTSLKTITIPKTTKTIGKKAFYNCKKLTTVTFASGSKLTKIGTSAFQKCVALKKVTIPDKVTSIGTKAFAGCSKLATVTINKTSVLKTIGTSAFDSCKALTKITLPKTVTTIGTKAFYNCTKLATVTFRSGSKLTKIGTSAFQKCISLKKITLPKTVTSIGNKAFYKCSKLATITFRSGSKLTKIGTSAFQECVALKNITIPSKVKTIGSKAFYKCSKLAKITVKSTVVKTVGKDAFKSIYKKAKIYLPKAKYASYKKLFKKGQAKTVAFKKA